MDLEPLFPSLAGDAAERPALRFPEGTLNHRELRDAATAVAARLAGRSRVAVLAEPRIETAIAVIAGLTAGVAVVPVNPRSGTAELAHIVSDAAPEVLLAARETAVPEALRATEIIEVAVETRPRDDTVPAAAPAPEDLRSSARRVAPLDPEAPALIVYTSGTTGAPKGAVLPRRAIASNLDALAGAWAWTETDEVAHGLPLFHVHGLVIGILGPVRRGGSATHLGRFSPEAVERALRGGATVLFGVPTMYRRLAEAAETSVGLARGLAGARLLVSGSAALPGSEHERIERLTGRGVLERYGMTETLMNTAVRAHECPRPGSVGPPLPGVELRLIDDAGDVLAVSDGETIGEIEVRGPNLFLGYLNRPEATAEAMRDGWFRTGDMATRDRDGHIRILGRRATDLIKSGGYKIGAGEIEGALREHPAVQDAAVTGEPDADLGERVVAWVVLRDGAQASADELVDHVASELAPHKRPRVVRFLDALPRNALGKVQKGRLTGG